MAENTNHYGKWQRAIRRNQELTQMELASRVDIEGFHWTSLSKFERGERYPKRETAVKIAKALNVPPTDAIDALNRDTPGFHPDEDSITVYVPYLNRLPQDKEDLLRRTLVNVAKSFTMSL